MAQHTIDLPCIADTYLDQDNPNNNYGSGNNLIIGEKRSSAGYYRRTALMRFDIGDVPARKKIISVVLRIYVTNIVIDEGGGTRCELVSSDFIENTATYNNTQEPSLAVGNYRNLTSISTGQYEDFNAIRNNWFRDVCAITVRGVGGDEINPSITFSSRETANPPILKVTYEDVPPNVPTPIEPVGVFKDSQSIIRFAWIYNSDVGGDQKAFDLQWSDDQSDWTTISETTSNTYYDMPADTFPAGNIYWRIRTYNEYDESSGYSDAAVFYSIGAPTSPAIQTVSNECRPVVEWSAFEQQIYQVQILQGEAVIYDTSDMPGIFIRQYRIPVFLEDGEYSARVRIKNEYDLWSEWGSTSFSISTTKPDKPTLSIQRSKYGLELTIGGAQEVSYIYRDGVCIARVTGEKYFDNTVANEKEYQYFIRALSEDGFADSDIEIGVPSFRYGLLNTGDEVIELKHNINTVPGKNLNNTQSGTLNMYDGRKYPVPEMSSNVEQTLVLGYFFKTYPEVEKIIEIADRKEIVLYRDKRGRKMYGKITGLAVQDIFHGHNVSITISATDYNEAVKI
jgi:hypothetical protein